MSIKKQINPKLLTAGRVNSLLMGKLDRNITTQIQNDIISGRISCENTDALFALLKTPFGEKLKNKPDFIETILYLNNIKLLPLIVSLFSGLKNEEIFEKALHKANLIATANDEDVAGMLWEIPIPYSNDYDYSDIEEVLQSTNKFSVVYVRSFFNNLKSYSFDNVWAVYYVNKMRIINRAKSFLQAQIVALFLFEREDNDRYAEYCVELPIETIDIIYQEELDEESIKKRIKDMYRETGAQTLNRTKPKMV